MYHIIVWRLPYLANPPPSTTSINFFQALSVRPVEQKSVCKQTFNSSLLARLRPSVAKDFEKLKTQKEPPLILRLSHFN